MDIRKISIGPDYKSGAMHYIVGQKILNDSHTIHLIQQDKEGVKVWIERDNEIYLWKKFNTNMPLSIEYNINFE
ncbi:MAG: hypothetical protein CBB97_13515 [Candidatus Endolissoclinum sp. TMED37]|nr:MAG: hypothetical protein CBB97_13515 [Candidatus Endolissoclinum sp. TMED37]|tara:strand:- start:11671 stop:11892 length:222 start_codon:yes stop_codon:yes gene_type:complete